MKKYLKAILYCGFFSMLIGLVSCEDYLDKDPDSDIKPEEAFKDFKSFQGFTEELYYCIPDFVKGYWTNSFNWGEDEIMSSTCDFHFGYKIDQGNFWGWQKEHDGWQAGWMDRNTNSTLDDDRFHKSLWPLAWYGIRKANIGLANIGLFTEGTKEEKDIIKGQLLFFRAWFHFELIQYFGGLPYIDQVLPSDQKLTLPRLSYHECADKVAADFRAAADLLPVDWDNTTVGKTTLGKNQLRINKVMALGYLGKNYLWAGSPLMNQESTGASEYNKEYCQKAAAAFAELLKICESGQSHHRLIEYSKIADLFYTIGQSWKMPGEPEAIFRGPSYDPGGSIWGFAKQFTPLTINDADARIWSPTANYVQYYGMANGLPITDVSKADAESGYDPEYPWKGRDPRFYNDFIWDGKRCVKSTTCPENNRYANLYSNGNYREGSFTGAAAAGSRTGYLMFKFIPITSNKYDDGFAYGTAEHTHLAWMRLADVYLMYAEAAAQAYGSAQGRDPGYSKTAVQAVNFVRDRAGVGHVADKFMGSLDVFMGEVRRERAVELAYEGHRFNDLRRWLLLTEYPYTIKSSHEFTRVGDINKDDPTQNRVANMREQVILERNFSQKHYWLPLKNADVHMYLEFPQNPGW